MASTEEKESNEILKKIISKNINNILESNITQKLNLDKGEINNKIDMKFIETPIEGDPVIIYYVKPEGQADKDNFKIGQHIINIGGLDFRKYPGKLTNRLKDIEHGKIDIIVKKGIKNIIYTGEGGGIGKTDIKEQDLITIKDENDQEVVLLIKPEKISQDNDQNLFSACVIKDVNEITENQNFIKKNVLIDRISNIEEDKDVKFSIIDDPNFILFNYFNRFHAENNNSENLHVFFNYKFNNDREISGITGLNVDENLIITYVDPKIFRNIFKVGDKIIKVNGYDVSKQDTKN